MQVAIVYNPVSGSGRSRRAGLQIARRLEEAGHVVQLIATALQPVEQWLDPGIGDCDVVVVVGGDGAVRMAAQSVARFDKALYHFPGGTENLFAREFGMDRCISRLVSALDQFVTKDIDLATANGALMVLMASVGFDAEVVHDLAARRGKSISHLSYLPPIARQLLKWSPPTLSISVDGRDIVSERSGVAVVANSRQYASRLNPAWKATMDDALLDVLFLPMKNTGSLLKMMAAHGLKQQSRLKDTIYERGAAVVIRSAEPVHCQIDGDPPAHVQSCDGDQRITELSVSLLNNKLRVLLPL